jgi:hypothetical protein
MARVNPRFGTPVMALVFASVLTGAVLVILTNFPAVALLASITTLVPYGAAALALLVLRRTDPSAHRPYRMPAALVLAPAAFTVATILVYWASWPWTLVGVLLMLVAIPLYFLFTQPKFRTVGRLAELGLVVGGLTVVGSWLVYAAPTTALFSSAYGVYLSGLPIAPVVGSMLLFLAIPAYLVTLLLRKTTYAESRGVLWIATYLGGLGIISYLGDQFFIYENFLSTGPPYNYPVTLQPMGLLNMPWDLVVLVAFALAMFLWGYRSALRLGTPVTEPLVRERGEPTPVPTGASSAERS